METVFVVLIEQNAKQHIERTIFDGPSKTENVPKYL